MSVDREIYGIWWDSGAPTGNPNRSSLIPTCMLTTIKEEQGDAPFIIQAYALKLFFKKCLL